MQSSLISYFELVDFHKYITMLTFYMIDGSPNSGPHASVAGFLLLDVYSFDITSIPTTAKM